MAKDTFLALIESCAVNGTATLESYDKAAADAYADGILNYTVWSNLPEQQNLARAYKAAVAEVERLRSDLEVAVARGDAHKYSAEAAESREAELRKSLTFQLAQLRHAYMQLKAGTVFDQPRFADGLISPAIKALEKALEVQEV